MRRSRKAGAIPRDEAGKAPWRETTPTAMIETMNPLILIVILLLLFGGGGFYAGGPAYGGGGLGLVLIIFLIVYFMGGFRSRN